MRHEMSHIHVSYSQSLYTCEYCDKNKLADTAYTYNMGISGSVISAEIKLVLKRIAIFRIRIIEDDNSHCLPCCK